jgi:hypothetical protein
LDFDLRKRGEVDEEGWEYAHDFPRAYSRVRRWYCNVRRRRWIRVRKLKGTGHDGATEDKTAEHTCPQEQSASTVVCNRSLSCVYFDLMLLFVIVGRELPLFTC